MPDDHRPDPDALLARLAEAEAVAARGKLRIYFGANAGVGKTYAMLGAAQRELAAGRDVVAGLVETHGRAETIKLLAGLPVLPLAEHDHQGRTLREFDLDAALARRPAVLLVDELAHSNVPGSRHPKRWQDIEELRAAGIEVWSTLNVQHLESLNGAVGALTGIRVHETVPDTVLDDADEVVLVDVTPDELTARLAAGKVYLPQQAERAAKNFFRKGNLIALREMALRRTAEHVEDDRRDWRVEQSVAGAAGASPAGGSGLLACVGPHEGAEDAVRTAARLAGQLNVRWCAAYVETPRLARLPAARRDHVLAVLKLAEELGASTAVLSGRDAVAELVAHAGRQGCGTLVLGRRRSGGLGFGVGRPGALRSPWRRTLAARLAEAAPSLDLVEAGEAVTTRRLARLVRRRSVATLDAVAPVGTPAVRASGPAGGIEAEGDADRGVVWSRRLRRYALATAICAGTALAATPLAGVLDAANIVMVFLLATVGVAMRFGRGPAAWAAVLNVAVFDVFFVPPRFSFAVHDVQYLITFVVMLLMGLLVGQLTAGLRFEASVSAGRERRAQSLFELARELSAALVAQQVEEAGRLAVERHFGGRARVLVAGDDDRLSVPPVEGGGESATTPDDAGFDAGVADWALRNTQSAGLGTATLAAQSWHYVPLKAPMRVRGVLALRPAEPRWLLVPEQAQHLDALARQIAIALERVHYVEIAQRALVDMESERLRNTLLAAISHDVRTPLTALVGLAESLARARPPLDAARLETAHAIAGEARKLSELVGNLLEMARLQSGAVNLRMEWQSVEEVVGAAIRAAGPGLGDARVVARLDAALPMVEFDAMLLERVLVNLLENAARHGAPPIEVAARAEPRELVVTVRDHGPGLPAMPGGDAQLFDKFTRGGAESATPGVGLGLAICKAIVEAHGGRIRARTASGGGAEFEFALPRRAPPVEPASSRVSEST